MDNTEKSNFDFLQEIIEAEQEEKLKNRLCEILEEAKQAEEQVSTNRKRNYKKCLGAIDDACDRIAKLYMEKLHPVYYFENKYLCKNGKKKPGEKDIWKNGRYSEGWESKEEDLLLYLELFHLRGERNHCTHGEDPNYEFPETRTDEEGRMWLIRDETKENEVVLQSGKFKADPKKYKTLQNAYQRFQNMFNYLCAVLVKCGYISEEDLPSYEEPGRRATVAEDMVVRQEDATVRAEEAAYELKEATKEMKGVLSKLSVDYPNQFDSYKEGGDFKKTDDTDEPGSGSKKKYIIIVSVIMAAILLGVAAFIGTNKQASSESSLDLEQDIDSHIIMKLSNANHQYEVGLENWKRLDYNRAERDITGAISDITEEKSQAEIDVAKVNNSLGCLYLDMGKYEASYDYLNNAYVTFRDEYGEGDPQTLAVLFSIAQYDYYIGDYDSALKIAQQILDSTDIANNKTVATLVRNLQASIYSNRGNYEKALEMYKKVLGIYKEYIKDDTLINELADYTEDSALDANEREKYTNMVLAIAKTYENIGEVYTMLGKNEEAMDAIKVGLNMCLDNIYIGKKNISTANLYLQKAATESIMGSVDEAIEDTDLAIRIERNLFDFEDVYPGLVEAYDLYGMLMEKQNNSGEASDYYNSALELALESFGENHPNTAEAYYYCGLYAYNEKRYEEAEQCLLKAVEIRKNILGEKHPNTMKYYLVLSSVESALGKEEAADKYKDAAESIKNDLDLSNAFINMLSVDADFLKEEFPENSN